MTQPITADTAAPIPVADVESAINVWRALSSAPAGVDDGIVLCREARVLADLYGKMIFDRLHSVPASTLSAEQLAALNGARL
ncbi:DUF3717 domain-containing protein [Paraburkholderia sp. BCC1876]|uniref:DUF3717 domain-containing protein n=1 Tax=Paraburkholderia sp. BCC1876 TaxID=2676303 RepID=UPI001590BD5D|nr:DUF3717 domain-containing protein [Paraburkholderia sp. BCC1876]